MSYRMLGGIKQKYYTWEIHGEIRHISTSRESIEEMISSWSPVPNSGIGEYYLEYFLPSNS